MQRILFVGSDQSDSNRICRDPEASGGKTVRRNNLKVNIYRLPVFPANLKIEYYSFVNLLVLLFISLCGRAQQPTAKVYTLKQCIETGISNSLDVRQSGLQAEVSKINWNQARLNMLPSLNGSIGHGSNQGRSIDPFTNGYINQQVSVASYNLNSGVILFNGFSIQHTIKQNALSYEAAKMDWQQVKDNLTINIILAYLSALSNEDQLVQAQNQSELSNKQVQRLEILDSGGSIRPSDLYDIRGQFANDRLTAINIRSNLENAKLNLCQLMNILYDPEMRLERLDTESYMSQYIGDARQVYQTALSQFALIRATELRTRSAERAVKARRGTLFPVLSLNGGGNSNYSSAAAQNIFLNTTDVASGNYILVNGTPSFVIQKQDNFRSEKIGYSRQLNNNIYTSISLNLNIPIFNSLQTRNRLKIDKIEAKRFSIVEQTTKTQLQQDVERAHVNMMAAFDRYKTLLDQVHAYSESFKAAEIRFNEGLGTSIDYLVAKNNLDRANSNLIIAKYDYVLRTRVLDYYQGKAW